MGLGNKIKTALNDRARQRVGLRGATEMLMDADPKKLLQNEDIAALLERLKSVVKHVTPIEYTVIGNPQAILAFAVATAQNNNSAEIVENIINQMDNYSPAVFCRALHQILSNEVKEIGVYNAENRRINQLDPIENDLDEEKGYKPNINWDRRKEEFAETIKTVEKLLEDNSEQLREGAHHYVHLLKVLAANGDAKFIVPFYQAVINESAGNALGGLLGLSTTLVNKGESDAVVNNLSTMLNPKVNNITKKSDGYKISVARNAIILMVRLGIQEDFASVNRIADELITRHEDLVKLVHSQSNTELLARQIAQLKARKVDLTKMPKFFQ